VVVRTDGEHVTDLVFAAASSWLKTMYVEGGRIRAVFNHTGFKIKIAPQDGHVPIVESARPLGSSLIVNLSDPPHVRTCSAAKLLVLAGPHWFVAVRTRVRLARVRKIAFTAAEHGSILEVLEDGRPLVAWGTANSTNRVWFSDVVFHLVHFDVNPSVSYH
jgi:hypothetical protein